jgi:hypothetical protein
MLRSNARRMECRGRYRSAGLRRRGAGVLEQLMNRDGTLRVGERGFLGRKPSNEPSRRRSGTRTSDCRIWRSFFRTSLPSKQSANPSCNHVGTPRAAMLWIRRA